MSPQIFSTDSRLSPEVLSSQGLTFINIKNPWYLTKDITWIWNEILPDLLDNCCIPVSICQMLGQVLRQLKNRHLLYGLLYYFCYGTISVCIHLKIRRSWSPTNLYTFVTFNAFTVLNFGNIGQAELQKDQIFIWTFFAGGIEFFGNLVSIIMHSVVRHIWLARWYC